MATKYNGTLNSLRNGIADARIYGVWKVDRTGKHTFRSSSGGILNWWPSNGTVHFQGKDEGIIPLEHAFTGIARIEQSKQKKGKTSADHEKYNLKHSAKPRVKQNVFSDDEPNKKQVKPNPVVAAQGRIYIVYGSSDNDASLQLELILRNRGIEDIEVFDCDSNRNIFYEAIYDGTGRDHSNDFGIILLTPEEEGSHKRGSSLRTRANQNLILRAGFILSAISRNRVAVIVEAGTEIPRDLQGLMRMSYNESISEIVPKLCHRLQEEKFEITQP